MDIICLTTGYMESNCYLVVEQGHAVIIDPGEAEIVLSALEEGHLQADFGIITHEHCDHIFGCAEIRKKIAIPFYASSICDLNMRNDRMNFSRYFDAFVNVQNKLPSENRKRIFPFSANADKLFNGKLDLPWQGHFLKLRETPGHSQGSICILVDQCELFVGDTLLANDLTGVRFLGSSQDQLEEITIPWLKCLPSELRVWPGHGPTFILGERLGKPITKK